MTKKIKVVETRTYFYVPDLNDEGYCNPDPLEDGTVREPAQNMEQAMEIDKQDIDRGLVDLDEFTADFPTVTREWEIVDVDE